jgi:hypothetical protein
MAIKNKISKLVKRVDDFCLKALGSFLLIRRAAPPQGFHMPDDDTEISESGDLASRAEQFDIKNEDLFNQFEVFMAAYNELIEALQIDPEHLDQDTFEEAGQLIDTLNKRYERIMSNPYLNMGENYEEDFNPGDFSKFVQEVVADAEKKLQNIAGEDINISEMRANQYAQEFNDNKNIDRGDQNITWTGNKVQQNLEARKEWFKKLMFIKKVGKSHPEYERYDRYITLRREGFKRFLDNLKETNPAKWREWQNKENERVRKHFSKEENIQKKRVKDVEKAKKIKEIKQSGTLEGYITHLKQKIASKKSDVVKVIKPKAGQDPFFNPYKKAVADAKLALDTNPSPAAQKALEDAIRSEAEALKNYLDNHPAVVKVKEDLARLYAFRDKAKMASDNGWVGDEGIAPEVKPHLFQLVVEGEELDQQYRKQYKVLCDAINQITEFIKGKL